jgi:tripartite-type tricarboxylate transporter receptor subunit TctC
MRGAAPESGVTGAHVGARFGCKTAGDHMKHVRLAVLFFAVASGIAPAPVRGQEYPSKPVRIVVGFAAGGSVDLVARVLAQKLPDLWGQPVIVENRPGAGGTIAADLVAKAPPDGYTLLLGDISSNAAAANLYSNLPYDPIKDFAHVTRLVTFPLVLYVPAASPITSLNDLIAQAKAKPGMLRYGSGGVGTSPHLFTELINQMAGIKTEAIHYKGSAPSVAGLLAGDVEYSASSISTVLAQLQGGRVRAIAVTGAASVPGLPGVPPVSSAVPGYEALTFHGLHAPAKTPAAIVAKINRDVVKVMQLPDVKQRFDELSDEVSVNTPEEFTAYIRQQTELWGKVIRAGNIRAE